MVEQLVDIEIFVANFEMYLMPVIGEALAQLQQVLRDVRIQVLFYLTLFHILPNPHDVNHIRVFGYLLRQVALWSG